jgi:hypothetical protein
VEAIIAMSGALNLSEGECVRYWMAASRSDCRRKAEAFANLPANSFEVACSEAATYLFFLEGFKLLEIVLLLTKHRMPTSSLAEDKVLRSVILSITNEWIRQGQVSTILKTVATSWTDLLSKSASSQSTAATAAAVAPAKTPAPAPAPAFGGFGFGAAATPAAAPNAFVPGAPGAATQQATAAQNQLQLATSSYRRCVYLKLVEIIFFVFQTTQIQPAEMKELFELLQNLSNSLIDSSPPSEFLEAIGISPSANANSSVTGASSTTGTSDADECKRLGIQSFVILQLALAVALNPKTVPLNRNKDSDDANAEMDPTIAAFNFPSYFENVVRRNGGSGGDGRQQVAVLRSVGFAGFCYLLLAQNLQAMVDADKESPERVVYFLHQAAQNRSYTYLRLCVIPLVASLLTSTNGSSTNSCVPIGVSASTATITASAFYIDVVHEILADNAVLFDMYPMYNDPHYPDPDFIEYIRCRKLAQARAENPTCDYIDDVMNCYALMASLWPSFALHLATEGPVQQTNTIDDQSGNSMVVAAPNVVMDSCLYHPFFEKCRQICIEDRSLRAFVNLCRGVGVYNVSSNNLVDKHKFGVNSKGVYAFLRSHQWMVGPPREDTSMWGFLLCFFSEFAKQIRDKSMMLVTGGGDVSAQTPVNLRTNAVTGQIQVLSKADSEFLTDIADLIATLARCPEVAAAMIRDCNPINALFALVSCPVNISLKGAIFRALGSLAYGCPDCCDEIWNQLEEHRILQSSVSANPATADARLGRQSGIAPTMTRGGLQAQQRASQQQSGLLAELEGPESECGHYPCTTGFLLLLESLLTHSVPADIGLNSRLPGVFPYIDFVLDDVLGRLHTRTYMPAGSEGLAQKHRLTAVCVHILALIVRHYGINLLGQLETDNNSNIDVSQLSAADIFRSCQSTNAPPPQQQQARNNIVADLAADFLELQATYKCTRRDGQSQDTKVSRVKSMGFIIMSMLLGGIGVGSTTMSASTQLVGASAGANPIGSSSTTNTSNNLLSFVLNLLSDCSIPKLTSLVNECSQQQADSVLSIFCMLQPPSLMQAHTHLDLLSYGYNENLSEFGLLGSGVGHLHCDASYWKEKTVAACVGLLFECSLREQTFNHFVHRSQTPVTYTRYNTVNNRMITVPVVTQSLALRIGSTVQLGVIGT